MQYIAIAYCNY